MNKKELEIDIRDSLEIYVRIELRAYKIKKNKTWKYLDGGRFGASKRNKLNRDTKRGNERSD